MKRKLEQETTTVNIAVVGCGHGKLDEIYAEIKSLEIKDNDKINLVLVCGDFQAVRNLDDLACMNTPAKYKKMNSFYKYYSGESIAPFLTIFIGGNHEASNYLQELKYGGFVAPNIFYLGWSGVVKYKGISIGGISGIYNRFNLNKPFLEEPPYSEAELRSVYHVRREQEQTMTIYSRVRKLVFKEENTVGIFMSHDWPRGIEKFGDVKYLLKKKPFFRKEIKSNQLGSPVNERLLKMLKPSYWFSAHLHVRFEAEVDFDDVEYKTKFLALDKVLPNRSFMEVIQFQTSKKDCSKGLEYDICWLASVSLSERYEKLFSIANEEILKEYEAMKNRCENSLTGTSILGFDDSSFPRTVEIYLGQSFNPEKLLQPELKQNPQTIDFRTKFLQLSTEAAEPKEQNSKGYDANEIIFT
eukprot:augustus_masked-scaffold_40-processed-gene-2.47-mRNA-1 protein AED:0.28 eAED:0.28 QI:0/-1/0/1/-1/1/1/0/412